MYGFQTAHEGAKHFQALAMKRALYRSSNVPLSELIFNGTKRQRQTQER
jgi:hypothetical protein